MDPCVKKTIKKQRADTSTWVCRGCEQRFQPEQTPRHGDAEEGGGRAELSKPTGAD